MEKKDRDTIDRYCEAVVSQLNLVTLWPKLLGKKVYNRDDVNIPRWTRDLRDTNTIRDVYLTIKTRGPDAFQSLISSLRESGQENLADLLEGRKTIVEKREDTSTNNAQYKKKVFHNPTEAEPSEAEGNTEASEQNSDSFFHSITCAEEPLRIQVLKATEFMDSPEFKYVQCYPMRSNPRGLVLLITNINYPYMCDPPRISAQHDETNLNALFEQMGYQVHAYRDLTGQELIAQVKAFSQLEILRVVDSCFVIISSHGNMNKECQLTEICGVDYHMCEDGPPYRTVLCSEIIDCFTSETCPHLAEKPKIFMFQACRGDKKQKSVIGPRETTDKCNPYLAAGAKLRMSSAAQRMRSVRNYADILLVHATMPGYAAFRDKITGSWFIQILCEVFMNYARGTHVQDLLSMVDERLKTIKTTTEECQTLMVTSMGFNKHCYLHPGLFEES